MFPSLLPLLVGDGPRYGEIPHLAKDELAVVTVMGGGRLYQARLAVFNDGTVTYTSTLDRKPERNARWRLSKGDLGALRLLVVQTDFAALHGGPWAHLAPSAVDADDIGLAVRQGLAVRGWSNTVWTAPETPVPLFVRLQDLENRARRDPNPPSRKSADGVAEREHPRLPRPA